MIKRIVELIQRLTAELVSMMDDLQLHAGLDAADDNQNVADCELVIGVQSGY